jgi:putative tricarboxylic transport membrane protein
MEEINNLMQGFAVAMTLPNLAYMLIGVTLGVLIGVLPGLGGANGIAILLPLTFSMNPTSAIIMLSCIYWGALFGGAITSILFNIPGEPWSVATTFDGYPMAQQGRAAQANAYVLAFELNDDAGRFAQLLQAEGFVSRRPFPRQPAPPPAGSPV